MKKSNVSILIVTISVVFYVIERSWGELQDHRVFDLYHFSLVILAQLFFLLLTVRRTQLVINAFSDNFIGYCKWLKLFLEGRIINNIAPQLGNVYRGVVMKRDGTFSYSVYATSQIFYVWVDALFNVLLSISMLLLFCEMQGNYLSIFYALCFVAIAFLFVPMSGRFLGELDLPRWLSMFKDALGKSLSLIGNKVSCDLVFSLLVLGIISAVFFVSRIYVGFLIFGENLSFQDLVVFFALLKLSSVMLITPGNVGVQEVSMGLMSEFLGYGMAIGVAVMLTLRIYEYILYLLTWLALIPMAARR